MELEGTVLRPSASRASQAAGWEDWWPCYAQMSPVPCIKRLRSSVKGWDMLGHVGTCWDFPLTSFRHWYDTCVPHLSTCLAIPMWRLCWRDHCPWNAETLVWILSAILYRHEKHSASVPSHVWSSNVQFLDASSASSSRGGSFPEYLDSAAMMTNARMHATSRKRLSWSCGDLCYVWKKRIG